jgi:hypothetical protein
MRSKTATKRAAIVEATIFRQAVGAAAQLARAEGLIA